MKSDHCVRVSGYVSRRKAKRFLINAISIAN